MSSHKSADKSRNGHKMNCGTFGLVDFAVTDTAFVAVEGGRTCALAEENGDGSKTYDHC